MSDKRRGLGRGLGALIPSAPPSSGQDRPVDVFFPDSRDRSGGVAELAARAGLDADRPQSDADPSQVDRSAEAERSEPVVAQRTGSAEGLQPVPGASFAEIPVASIAPNPRQPRQVFDEDEMAELVSSIAAVGVLQPVVVRSTGDGRYELIMGERRWRAVQAAGQPTIPAIVRETGDEDLLRDALLENLHRSELNPLEEAAAYQQLLEDFGCTHEVLATRIGRSRPQISNTIRLLRLPPLVQRRVAAGVLSAGHARALLGLDDPAGMERLAQRIVAEGLSVRATEEIVSLGEGPGQVERTRRPRSTSPSPELAQVATRLADRLDTRVNITMGKSRGKLSVDFASVEDLHRILSVLAPELDSQGA